MKTTVSNFLPLFAFAFACATGCRPRQFNQDSQSQSAKGTGEPQSCDIVIAGGTTAATAAAISAAQESIRQTKGARKVCLLEPTDWPGGQLTASGVTAIDFDHIQKGADGVHVTTKVANNAKTFANWVSAIAPATNGAWQMGNNPGMCWVSVRCYLPQTMLSQIKSTFATFESSGVLKVFYNTVPKSIKREGKRILSLTAIQRTPKSATEKNGTYDFLLSARIADWYDPTPSKNYNKEVITFTKSNNYSIFIDATEWGELLALANVSYMQGTEGASHFEDTEVGGQAFVYPIAVELADKPQVEPANLPPTPGKSRYDLSGGGGSWEKNWNYRRMKTTSKLGDNIWNIPPRVGDITQMNITTGNDYPFKYLFVPKSESARMAADGTWNGGVDVSALAEAEAHAFGFFRFLRQGHENIKLSTVYGTTHGLTKVPYMRDTRRSIGYDNYMVHYRQIEGDTVNPETNSNEELEAIAIGLYAADIHATDGSGFKSPKNPKPKPFKIPFSALTNKDLDNFLVAGKTIAQTPWVNAATRLHPIEFNIGTGAGVAALFMNQYGAGAEKIYRAARALTSCPLKESPEAASICAIRSRIRTYAPLEFSE